MTKLVTYSNGTVSLPGHLWDRIVDALDRNGVAWEGEEDSVKEEHEELIEELESLGFYLAAHGGVGTAELPELPSGPLSSFDYELLADALDVLDADGSEATNRTSELEAWARSMAATGRGYLPAAGVTAPPIRVLCALEGGCLTHVGASVPGVQLVTLDYDTEGADEAELFDIPQDGGGTAQAFRSVGECDHDTSGFWEGARDARPSAPLERLAMLRKDQEGEGAYFEGVRAEGDALEAWLAEDEQHPQEAAA